VLPAESEKGTTSTGAKRTARRWTEQVPVCPGRSAWFGTTIPHHLARGHNIMVALGVIARCNRSRDAVENTSKSIRTMAHQLTHDTAEELIRRMTDGLVNIVDETGQFLLPRK